MLQRVWVNELRVGVPTHSPHPLRTKSPVRHLSHASARVPRPQLIIILDRRPSVLKTLQSYLSHSTEYLKYFKGIFEVPLRGPKTNLKEMSLNNVFQWAIHITEDTNTCTKQYQYDNCWISLKEKNYGLNKANFLASLRQHDGRSFLMVLPGVDNLHHVNVTMNEVHNKC